MKSVEKLNRIRPLKIWEILQKETDEDHPMGTEHLRMKLRENGIEAHRTTIYEDIKLLKECGYEVLSRRGRSNLYYVMDRKFSDPEIHILLDAVQAASFISEKKTGELVDKIAQLAGSQKAEVLKKNIVRFNTAKNTNESIYYNVDEITAAIGAGTKVTFRYFDYDIHHSRVYRKDGERYTVNPLATVFDNGHYYLVAYDKQETKIKNYRIDRMDRIQRIEEIAEMPPESMHFDIGEYKRSIFEMFAGEKETVTIEADIDLIDAIFDLFGDAVKIRSAGEGKVRFSADVQVSSQFFGWCCSFGEKVKLVAPHSILVKFKKYVDTLQSGYKTVV